MRWGVALLVVATACASARPTPELTSMWVRGRALTENGELQGAVEEFRRMIAAAPDRPEPLVFGAIAARRGENFELARTWSERALRLDPTNHAAHFQLALLANHLRQPREALSHLEAIVAPTQASYFYQRGVALRGLDRDDDARDAFRRARDLDDTLFQNRYALFLLLRATEPAEAERELAAVERLRDEQPDWVRGDHLRLEAGPLTDMAWPEPGRRTSPSRTLALELIPVRNQTPHGTQVTAYGPTWKTSAIAEGPRLDLGVGRDVIALRVVWPNGIVQHILDPGESPLRVREELFIKGSWGGVRVR